jgi:hypothetical protein
MKKALFIGINYTSVPTATLKGCIDDVVNLSQVLKTYYGFDASNILMLRDDTDDPARMPTRANILSSLASILANAEPSDEIWIHYSGHGGLIRNISESVIVPVDYLTAGFITETDFYAIVQSTVCPTIIFMDSCNSGGMCVLEWSHEYLQGRQFLQTHYSTPSLVNPDILMFSGSKQSQDSLDVYDNVAQEYEGVFTDGVLHALKQNQYQVSLGKLVQDVCVWFIQNGVTSQKPMLYSSSSMPSWDFTPIV